MGIIELIILAVGLAMDAFAVSVCKGLSVRELRGRHLLACGLWFGIFQMLMPLIGFFFGALLHGVIERVDHWIAFILLALIGVNMIREALAEGDEGADGRFGPKAMLPLAVATSIDALAVGISFAMLEVAILPASALIGVITFCISCIGVKIGNVFGARYRAKAEIAGGVILILIGLRILLQQLLGF